MAGISPDRQAAAAHQASRPDADIARDVDHAAGQAGTDLIEPVAGAFDADIPRLIPKLRKEMKVAADRYDFERAAELRDRIFALQERELELR